MLQENEKYEKAKSILIDKTGKPTPHYQAYMHYQNNWQNKKKVHQAAYADALTNPIKLHVWAVEGKLYMDDIDKAMDEWIALGYKNEIENAINILASQATDPAVIDLIRKAKYGNQ